MKVENHLKNMKLKNSVNIFNKVPVSINTRLVSTQGVNEESVENIIKLHKLRSCYCSLMSVTDDKEKLRQLAHFITQIDYQLQKLWNFSQDYLYHRFWELPKCECPKSDNIDTYGTGHRYINPNCPLHGR